MKDIETRTDIETLLQSFYAKAFKDELISFYFTEVIKLNLETHLPIIANFWETILLQTNKYNGDPMNVHKHIHALSPFKAEHFDRWVLLFQQTVSEMFEGNTAELAKQRAASIATVMKIKLLHGGIQNNKP
jgi:hemoglobin